MISAIQNYSVNNSKPLYNMTFCNNKFMVKGAEKVSKAIVIDEKPLLNTIKGLPNTLEKFICWIVGFKG